MGTVTAGCGGKSQMVAAFLSQYHSYDDSARGQKLDRPLLTQDTSHAASGVVLIGKGINADVYQF
jgi:hypothetical protein